MNRGLYLLFRRLILLVAASGVLFLLVTILRSRVRVQSGVVYGIAGSQQLFLDVHRPLLSFGARPAVLLIHGGGWVRGSRTDLEFFAVRLARAGFVCFSIDYRLAASATNHYPAQLDDVQRAVRWVRAHAKVYGIDPARLGAFGHSAGGHLAALLGTRETRDDGDRTLAGISSRVNCVIDTCGPTDFTDPSCPALLGGESYVLDLFFEPSRELARDASPLTHVSSASAPFLMFHGTRDEVVPIEQSRRLHRALRRAGVESTLIEMEGEGHSFADGPNPPLWLRETLAFFRRNLVERR